MNFDALAQELHKTAVDKGFYEDYDMTDFKDQSCKLLLLASEVIETMEALRKSKGSYKVVEELVDVQIRLLDVYAALYEAGVVTESFDQVLKDKAQVNIDRPYLHGWTAG